MEPVMPSETRRLSDLSDRMAIRETLEAYFSSVDRRDWAAYGACFTEDAQVAFHRGDEPVIVGRAALVRRAAERPDRPVSNHLLSNTYIEIAGDRAQAVTQGIAHLVVPGAAGTRIVVRGIVYHDELVADAARRWRIAQRVHRPLWQFEAPSMPLGY